MSQTQKNSVFISYSRSDREFVNKLRKALLTKIQNIWIDWESIPPSQVWWEEIKKGILQANNFVIIMSENSMSSPICQMEVEYAIEQGKRIIPVLHNDFDRDEVLKNIAIRLGASDQQATRTIWGIRQAHEILDSNQHVLRELNYFFFRYEDEFDDAFKALLAIISTDFEHKNLHTSYQIRAEQWERRNYDSGLLLVETELVDAKIWLAGVSNKQPLPTSLQVAFIENSREAEDKRLANLERNEKLAQRAWYMAILAIIVTVIAITFVFIPGGFYVRASNQISTAESAQRQAILHADNANTEQAEVQSLLDVAEPTLFAVETQVQSAENVVDSLQLASRAEDVYNRGDPFLGLSLALNASYLATAPQTERILSDLAYAPGARRRYEGHSVTANSVELSPDGSQLVSGSGDGSLILWDVLNGNEIRRYDGHSDAILSVAFSPNGSQLMSGSGDGSLILWDVLSGNEIRRYEGHSDAVLSVAFSPDGSQLISGSGDGSLILWDVLNGNEIRRYEGHEKIIYSVAFSPDGSQFVSGSGDGRVILWDVLNGREIRRYEGQGEFVLSVVFSPDGSQFVSSSNDGRVILWDVLNGREIRNYEGHSDAVYSVAFSSDGSQLVSGGGSFREFSELILWDVETGNEQQRYVGHSDRVLNVAFSPDGSQLVSSSGDGSVILWDVLNGDEIRRYEGHSGAVYSVAFSPDGSQIVSGSGDGNVIVWDVETGNELRYYERHSDAVYSVAFNPDGSQFVSSSGDGNVIVWDVETGNEQQRYEGHSSWVNSVAFSPDGSQLVSGSDDDLIILWDVLHGDEIRRYEGHSDAVYSVAFSPDGSQFASGSIDGSVILWDVLNGDEIRRYEGHSDAVYSVAFSPDGSQFASGFIDGSVILWGVLNSDEIRRYEGHSDAVWSVAFSPDGNQFVSSSGDDNVIVWDVATGNELHRYERHSDTVNSVAFSPDGSQIVSGSSDHSLILWRNDSPEQRQAWIIENRVLAEITCEERRIHSLEVCEDDIAPPSPTLAPTRTAFPLSTMLQITLMPIASPTSSNTPALPPTAIATAVQNVDRCGVGTVWGQGRRPLYTLGQTVVVDVSALRVRRNYDESDARNTLAQVYEGTDLQLVGGPICHNFNWYWQVQYQGIVGWIREAERGNPYICPLSNRNCSENLDVIVQVDEGDATDRTSQTDDSITYYIIGSSINARACPDFNCEVIDVLYYLDEIEVVDSEVDGASISGNTIWLEVIIDTKIIYLHSSLASPDRPVIVTAVPQSSNTTTNNSQSTSVPQVPLPTQNQSQPQWSCAIDYNCSDFNNSCSQVMSYFNACPNDPSGLDRDNDGIPCESICG